MGIVLSIVQFSASRLQKYINNSESFKSDLRQLSKNEIDKSVYLDKAWEAVHFILTGENLGYGDPPLCKAIYSRHFFDEKQDLGMGPASYLTPEQVREIHFLLESLDDKYVKEKYNPAKMNKLGIYQKPWDDNPLRHQYVLENFQKLKAFYKDAASKNHAIASYLG
jgi:hypothetical protein